MTERGEAKELRARELQPGRSPSCTQALSHCATQQRQNEVPSLIQSRLVPVFHQFNTHYLKTSKPLAIKVRLLLFLRKGQKEEKKIKDPLPIIHYMEALNGSCIAQNPATKQWFWSFLSR